MSMSFGSFFSSSSGVGNQNYLADYASIRNGSYSKLLKAYYGTKSSSTSASGSSKSSSNNILEKLMEERRNPKVSEDTQTANSNLPTKISNLKNSVTALQNEKTYKDTENGKTVADNMTSAMKDFVSNYNETVLNAKKSTLSRQTSNVASMMRATKENADQLKEIGITINANGTLQLNEGKLKGTDVSKVQEMFSSKNSMSYGSKVMSRLQFASISASTNTTDKTESTETNSTTSSGTGAAALKEASNTLASNSLYDKIKDKDGNEKYDIDKIFASAKSFVSNYNTVLDAAGSSLNSGVISNLARMKDKTVENVDALKQIGISVDAKGKLKIDEDTFKNADMSKVQNVFKNYGSSVSTSASLVDFYLTTQANTSSSYTSSGMYNVQGGLRYTDAI